MIDLNNNIVEMFCSQVQDRPEHTAVIYGRTSLTNAELYDAAKGLAAKLVSRGAGKGDVIPIIGRRDICYIEEMLAVLMTGAAFAAVDETFPMERKKVICEQVQARLILKDGEILDADAWMAGVEDQSTEGAAEEAGSFPADSFEIPSISPDDLAYVHFTSGTEGVPKGVKVQHRGSVLRTKWAIEELGNDGSDVLLVKSNLTFVASIDEITRGLMIGCTMVVLPQFEEKEPAKILSAISEHKVTLIFMAPTMLGLVVSEAERTGRMDELGSLKIIACVGEALRPSLAGKFLHVLPNTKIANSYGQTETATILAAWHQVTAEDVANEVIPVGVPPEGVSVYVIDEGRVCKPGESGEICVGDGGVSLGYTNDELNAKAYLMQEFEDGSPAKVLYHTGDRGRWSPDGNLIVLGRRDSQVKIHGQRVELGDVESSVASLPDVKECVVIAVKNKKGDAAICAYVVTHSGEGNATLLRKELSEKLPEYMLPSHIVFLEELPRNVNGKVDKTRLPKPETARTTRYVAPRSALESKVCKAFEEALEAEAVGINDSFYELGGDSLSAISLYTILESSVGNEQMAGMQVNDMIRAQTPANIAEMISGVPTLCEVVEIDRSIQYTHSREIYEHLISLRSVNGGSGIPVETTPSNRLLLRQPKQNVPLKFAFDKSVSLEQARRAVSQVMSGSVFEYAYDEAAGCYMQYPGVRDEITVLDITEAEADGLALELYFTLYKFDGSQFLSDVFMIVSDVTGAAALYIDVQHSVNDRESTAILREKINAALTGAERQFSHAVYSLPSGTEKETVSTDEFFCLVDELDRCVKDHPYTRKAVGRVLEPECYNDPIPHVMDLYLELNPLLAGMKKVPLATIVNGRNAENAEEIGCFITYRYAVYDTETHSITEVPDLQPEEDVEKRTDWIPLINYIGLFQDSRSREQIFTIQKGYEKAKYLHASRLDNELVLKLPVYE